MKGVPKQGHATPFRVCVWSLGYAVQRWKALAGVLASIVLFTVVDVLKPWPMIFVVDYILSQKSMPPELARWIGYLPGSAQAMNLVAWSMAATVLLFLLSWLVNLAGEYPSISLSQGMNCDVASDMFTKLQGLSPSFHGKSAVGDTVGRVTNDCSCASAIVKNSLLPVLWSSLSLFVMFWILFTIDRALTLFALAVVPCMVLVIRAYSHEMSERGVRQQNAEGQRFRLAEQAFSTMPAVQAFCREEENQLRFIQAGAKTLRAAEAATVIQLRFNFLIGLSAALGTAAIFSFAARRAGGLSAGNMIAFIAYLGSLYTPLQSIMNASGAVNSAMGSAHRVWEVLRLESEVQDAPGAVPLVISNGRVQMQKVSFSYQPGRPVLRDINLDAARGQIIAVVGASGAGKTTLLSLLLRFWDPTEGRILIDSQDIRAVQLKSLRQSIALVSQEVFLFPTSIAENIAFGFPNATQDQIQAAGRAANAHEFILRLPHGYETMVGERGATLSGGERQRIALARAIIKGAPILILDEPTSALDIEAECSVMEAIALARDRTTFVIAHKFSTLRIANRIIVLDNGTIVEDGTHEELWRRRGYYHQWRQFQSIVPEDAKRPS